MWDYNGLKKGGAEGTTVSDDYSVTVLEQHPEPTEVGRAMPRAGPGSEWKAHTLNIAEMVRADYGKIPNRAVYSLGELEKIPRRFIVEGVR